jgi:hypothetical protein
MPAARLLSGRSFYRYRRTRRGAGRVFSNVVGSTKNVRHQARRASRRREKKMCKIEFMDKSYIDLPYRARNESVSLE